MVLVYDGACGSGGMLTESQNFIQAPDIAPNTQVFLYGKEVNGETYAICKSDMMIKGNSPENIRFGSTLATNDFSELKFDFMLENPPYGKSWKSDQKYIMDGNNIMDSRFEVELPNFEGEWETVKAVPNSSDGQLLFLMDMVNRMKPLTQSPLGSRIGCVHNGSALFTGDAGSGQSNIRRYIIENDWLEAIIQLPQNMFYNTGISTYVWVLSNNKSPQRQGKVQLIDASEIYRKLRKNLGEKNCELAPEQIQQITEIYQNMETSEISKVFGNEEFGFYKATVERPLRLTAQFTPERAASLRFVSGLEEVMSWVYEQWGEEVYTNLNAHKKEIEAYIEEQELNLSPTNRKALLSQDRWCKQRRLMEIAEKLAQVIRDEIWHDFNLLSKAVDDALKDLGIKLNASEKKQILGAVSWQDENAAPVVKKVHKLKGDKLDELLERLGTTVESLPDFGYWETEKSGVWVEYESDSDLRDTEDVPLNYALSIDPTTNHGRGKQQIHEFFLQEVRPHVADAWLDLNKTQIGYEISFNKYFYQHEPLRSLEEVTQEIWELEQETEGLLKNLLSFGLEDTNS